MSHPVELIGLLLAIVIPVIIIVYLAKKRPSLVKRVGSIFAIVAVTGIIMWFAFEFMHTDGSMHTNDFMIHHQIGVEEPTKEVIPEGKIFAIQILKDSFQEGNPDYAPDVAVVSHGDTIQWTNEDSTIHTVTSKSGFGKIFDSGSMDAGDVFTLNTSNLAVGEYEYLCVVHPWMVALFTVAYDSSSDSE